MKILNLKQEKIFEKFETICHLTGHSKFENDNAYKELVTPENLIQQIKEIKEVNQSKRVKRGFFNPGSYFY